MFQRRNWVYDQPKLCTWSLWISRDLFGGLSLSVSGIPQMNGLSELFPPGFSMYSIELLILHCFVAAMSSFRLAACYFWNIFKIIAFPPPPESWNNGVEGVYKAIKLKPLLNAGIQIKADRWLSNFLLKASSVGAFTTSWGFYLVTLLFVSFLKGNILIYHSNKQMGPMFPS